MQQWYVKYPIEGPWYELLVIPLRFELLCSIMIPISIKVCRVHILFSAVTHPHQHLVFLINITIQIQIICCKLYIELSKWKCYTTGCEVPLTSANKKLHNFFPMCKSCKISSEKLATKWSPDNFETAYDATPSFIK